MISDKFLDTLEPETASHIKIMQADQWMTPDELGKACDIFFISKNRSLHDSRNPNTFKSKNDDVYSKKRANMGYTNQFQRQFPKHNQSVRLDKTVSCYICGGPHFARNCTKKMMNSEKRNKDTGHAANQIETSISNQNNFLFNELQYVEVIVDDTPLRATLDSGANSVIINSNGIRDKVQTLIENYSLNKTETTALKMKIILSDEKPIAQRSRRLSLPEKREVEKQIDEWLEQRIIRESCSDFSSLVVVCKKKDGTMRFYIDYRKLNKKIGKDRYPLPIIEEVLDKLGHGKIFTTLDLKNAFFHVDVDEVSRKYTAFVTETGQYEFLKVPFGLSISSNYFQRYINYMFKELLRDGTLIIYLDGIIIPATDEKEAYKKLARVLETASRYGIELNLKKWYFRKCIPSYAMIARPLSDLLRGTNHFEFVHAQKIAFQNLKNALSSEPVLHLFKEGAKLELHTDACKLGLGAVLLQQEALKKFRNYLLGRKFRIQTDCAAFAKTLDKKELTPKMARWSIFLTDFDYKIANAQESVDYIRTLKKLLQEGKTSDFIVSNKILYKISEDQELLVVPEMMQVDVIKKAHSFGHFAVTKTEELVKRDYYFSNMRRCIENVIKNCVECLIVNKKMGKGEGFLNPIPKEDLQLSTFHVDFIGPLPATNKNYNHIFTVIDAFTKFTWLYPTKSTTAQEGIERLKLQQKTFGKSFTSD
ncbi:transposon Tf2-11 polyprotein [Trichonephila clavipes]|nr:transposon Tf2-11 polyprotein [Trichonephila clavipes]